MIFELKNGSVFLLVGLLGLTGCRSPVTEAPAATAGPISAGKIAAPMKSSGFQPTFLPPAEKSAFDYAYTIYRSSSAAPTGVYTYLGVVYVIVNIDTGKVKTRFPKGPAMLKAKEMLERQYPLPARYSLFAREIESREYRRQKNYRYVLAYRESDILKCCRTSAAKEGIKNK